MVNNNKFQEFYKEFHIFQEQVYENAKAHGWYNVYEVNDGEKIALMHSELSEALEALRHDNPRSNKIAHSQLEEELADCIIRILDFAGHKKLDIAGAMIDKHNYNIQRPYKHGKRF